MFNMSTRPTENTPDAFVVSRTVLQTLGGLDGEQFPMHYEEANLGTRFRKLGLGDVVAKNARIHNYGSTGVSLGRTMVRATMSDGAERARRMAWHRSSLPRCHL